MIALNFSPLALMKGTAQLTLSVSTAVAPEEAARSRSLSVFTPRNLRNEEQNTEIDREFNEKVMMRAIQPYRVETERYGGPVLATVQCESAATQHTN